jgi:hypothetical protein
MYLLFAIPGKKNRRSNGIPQVTTSSGKIRLFVVALQEEMSIEWLK